MRPSGSYLTVLRMLFFLLRFRLFFSTLAAVSLADFVVDAAAFGVIFFSAIWLTSSDRSGPAGLDRPENISDHRRRKPPGGVPPVTVRDVTSVTRRR